MFSFIKKLSVCCLTALLSAAQAQPIQPASDSIWLMGEIHDNRQGMDARVSDLRSALKQGWRPVLVLEQFNRERQDALDRAQKECRTAECVIDLAADPGWDWEAYVPLLNLALEYKLPLYAGNLSREESWKIIREGYASVIDAVTLKKFGLDGQIPVDIEATQQEAIRLGHCNLLPPNMIQPMSRAQIARDVWLAKLISEYASRGVVLVAGNGHIRRDVGVPRWLSDDLQSRTVVWGYVEPEGVEPARYDRLRIVSPIVREDPCIKLREQFAKKRG